MSQLSGTPSTTRSGFTLVMTLSILAAVTILVVGLFSIVARERKTSTSFDAVEQADLAVQAGLEQAGALLKEALKDENGIIMAVPTAPWITDVEVAQDTEGLLQIETGKEPRSSLIAANFKPNGSSVTGGSWTYVPLVSGVSTSEQQGQVPPDTELRDLKDVVRPAMPGVFVNGESNFTFDPIVPVQTPEALRELKHQVQRLTQYQPWFRTPSAYWVELTRPKTVDDPQEVNGETVASRFCFYVEDLQGLVNLGTAGNVDPATPDVTPVTGLHSRQEMKVAMNVRTGYPRQPLGFHAVPGLNVMDVSKPLRNQTSIHTLLQPNVDSLTGAVGLNARLVSLNQRLVGLRPMMFSPDMWRESILVPDTDTQWAGMEEATFSQRYQVGSSVSVGRYAGELVDPVLSRLERSVTAGLVGYDELALIPFEPGILQGGQRKVNLNAVLRRIEKTNNIDARATQSAREVNTIATHIQQCLPSFGILRAGGYPFPNAADQRQVTQSTTTARAMGYLKCLAAGIVDYADTDALPNMDGDPTLAPEQSAGNVAYPSYRGIDAYPLVSEQWQRYRWEGKSQGLVRYSVTSFVELWNMTNQEISGEVAASFECNGTLTAGAAVIPINKESVASNPALAVLDGVNNERVKWHKPIQINPVLRPNEYIVVKFPEVIIEIPVPIGSVDEVEFKGQDGSLGMNVDWKSRYRLAYRPPGAKEFRVVDQSLRPIDRDPRKVGTPPSSSPTQRFNTSSPAGSYWYRPPQSPQSPVYANNLGDPRGSFFINEYQALINYEDGSSPWGRNVRRGSIYNRFFGQNRVYLWPDGGHNTLEPRNPGALSVNPDNQSLRPTLHAQNSAEERAKFVQVISNRGRFYSVTELGHVFDPIMWDVDGGSEMELSSTADKDVKYTSFADVGTAIPKPSAKFCGGNTLRIGRPEHTRFRPDFSAFPQSGRPSTRAASATALLDLFHCGKPTSELESDVIGDFVRIEGQVNINTATRDALRAALAGKLVMDTQIRAKATGQSPGTPIELQPPTSQTATGGSSAFFAHADLLAELIIRNRPYVSPAQLSEKVLMPTSAELGQRPLPRDIQVATVPGRVLTDGQPVMGATARSPAKDQEIEPEWNDAAAEEAFGRIFNNATVRSRNFRIVVCGQAVRKTRSGETKVLATRSRLYHVFIRPIRDATTGNIIRQKTEILYARTL